MGTVNVLDAVRTHGEAVRAVVNVTSDKCYENREWDWGYALWNVATFQSWLAQERGHPDTPLPRVSDASRTPVAV
jgi:hypothetical protein